MSGWTNFQSGCGICKKSTDYYSLGGSSEEQLNDMFFKKNLGLNYATTGGKKRRTKSKSRKSEKKSSKSRKSSSKKSSSRKTSRKTSKKKTRGGGTNWGQTGFPLRYFGSDVRVAPHSGVGVQSAYGKIEPRDVGVGNLAPFNTAKLGPRATNQQTGGKKRGITKTRGKDGKMYYFKNGKRISRSKALKGGNKCGGVSSED